MKVALLATAILLLPSLTLAQPTQSSAEPAVDQADMAQAACQGLQASEATVKSVYQKVLKQYSYDKLFVKYLEASQKAWEAYLDSEMNALYPSEYRAAYGSSLPICICTQQSRLINERIKELNQWLVGAESCNGTIMRK